MHQITSNLNKAKREPFLTCSRSLTGITEIIQQVTAYRKIFSSGYQHLTPGRIIMLLLNHAIAGPQSGSFRDTPFQNGERPKFRVRFYGFMGNVS